MASLGHCTVEEWPRALPNSKMLIGKLKNNGIKRDVTVYHIDANLVYTVGIPFDGGDLVAFIEQRQPFEDVIARFPERVVWGG